jgi:hypothetical protein
MKIQINTDRNIQGSKELDDHIILLAESKLKHFATQITRLEVHISDQNGEKFGKDDTHCRLEARLENRPPLSVLAKAENLHNALVASMNKLKSALDSLSRKPTS